MPNKKKLDSHHKTNKNNSFRFYKKPNDKLKKISKKSSKKKISKKSSKKKIISDIDFINNIIDLKDNEFIKIIPIENNSSIPPQLNILDMLLNQKKNNKLEDFSSDSDSDEIEYDLKNDYDEIECTINNIQELINFAKKYKTSNKKLAFNNDKLYKLIEPMEELNEMIGMHKVKKQVINQIIYSLQGLDKDKGMMHTVITGPPGVGKTMLGYILAKIYYKMGLVKHKKKTKFINPINGKKEDFKFTIARRSDLIGEYVGHTATKTQKVINDALGGVLFIDEAYSLGNEEKKDIYSKECIDTLNQNLSENKGKIIVIIAGYEDSLEKCFFAYNQGLKRRFSFRYNIDDYDYIELSNILKKQIYDINWNLDININNDDYIEFFKKNYKEFKNFGGDMELLLLCTKIIHSIRIFGKHPKHRKNIILDDIYKGYQMFISSRKIKNDKQHTHMYI
jgi:SpoVK/Ycf46/Vps4 family AAA+-type ATPase